MRLLFLNHNLREHGTYFRALHLARELVARGHEVALWTVSPERWYRSTRREIDGVSIVETPSWSPLLNPDDGWGPLDIAWRSLRIWTERADLVYAFAHPPNIYLPAWIARRVRRIPLVVDWCDVYRDGIFPQREKIRAYSTPHAGESAAASGGPSSASHSARKAGARLSLQRAAERYEARLERRILRMADGVTVISHYLEIEALAAGVPADRLLRFPSGANLDAIRPTPEQAARDELSAMAHAEAFGPEACAALLDAAQSRRPLLGYIANYNPDEEFFLDALARVFKARPDAALLAACPQFTPGLVERFGVAPNLIALGRRPFAEMNRILGASDLLLAPLEDNVSNRGRWPNKFGDYLAAGRAVVTNDVGDAAEYVRRAAERGEPVGVAAPCESAAFAGAILQALAHPNQLREWGAAARRLAEGELAWPKLAIEAELFLAKFARPGGR